jgi:hypothetical protein
MNPAQRRIRRALWSYALALGVWIEFAVLKSEKVDIFWISLQQE